jgi:hypothetical protein
MGEVIRHLEAEFVVAVILARERVEQEQENEEEEECYNWMPKRFILL